MKLYKIETGFFKLDGGAMFGVVPKVLWNKLNPADEQNLCTWAMRCLLVEDGNRLILIDTGIGDKQNEKFFSHFHPHGEASLKGSLQQHGFHPDDITDVFLTHLHFDHVGGAVYRNNEGKLLPTFKNATYWSNEDHWNWAIDPNPREKASFLAENIVPIQESGQLKFINEGESLIEGFKVRLAHGHTEAMMIPQITVGEQMLCYMADLLPSPHHIPGPYVMSYDMRPLQTMAEKDVFLKEALENNYLLMYEHDPVNEISGLINTPKGIRANEIGRFEDYFG